MKHLKFLVKIYETIASSLSVMKKALELATYFLSSEKMINFKELTLMILLKSSVSVALISTDDGRRVGPSHSDLKLIRTSNDFT
jgi:hypothetical protein